MVNNVCQMYLLCPHGKACLSELVVCAEQANIFSEHCLSCGGVQETTLMLLYLDYNNEN